MYKFVQIQLKRVFHKLIFIIMQAFYFVKRFPRRFKTANQQKIFSLAQSLLNNGYQVSFVSADLSDPQSYKQLEQYPIRLIHVNEKKISASLSAAQVKPDLTIFNNFQMQMMYSAYVYNKWFMCPRILEINNLSSVQKWRKANYLYGVGAPIVQFNSNLYNQKQIFKTNHHKQSILRSDFIFCPNDFIYFLTKLYTNQADNISIINYGYRMQDYLIQIKQRDYRPFQSRKHICLILDIKKSEGLLLIRYSKQIFLQIKKQLKDVQLHIYSSSNDPKLFNLKKELQPAGIFLKGYMQDTKDIQKYRLTIYPAKNSVGLKGKIIQSWLNHTPVVTTPVGSQGMFFESLQAKFVTPQKVTEDGFLNQRQYTQAQIQSQNLVKRYYSNNCMGAQLKKLTFGGSNLNWTVEQFTKSCIQLYTNKQKWEKALSIAQKTMLKNQSENQMEKNLKYSFSKLQLAMYKGRGSKQYDLQWKRFIRAKEYQKYVYTYNSQHGDKQVNI